MAEELKIRFTAKTIQDILEGNNSPTPTVICEMDRIEIIELVRRYCLFSTKMVKLTAKNIEPFTEKGLEIQKKPVEYGELYILVNIN